MRLKVFVILMFLWACVLAGLGVTAVHFIIKFW